MSRCKASLLFSRLWALLGCARNRKPQSTNFGRGSQLEAAQVFALLGSCRVSSGLFGSSHLASSRLVPSRLVPSVPVFSRGGQVSGEQETSGPQCMSRPSNATDANSWLSSSRRVLSSLRLALGCVALLLGRPFKGPRISIKFGGFSSFVSISCGFERLQAASSGRKQRSQNNYLARCN